MRITLLGGGEVLTYAHLDHTGRLPLLIRFGYTKPIYATPATDLTDLILRDSAWLQSEDTKRPTPEPLRANPRFERLVKGG
jgi:predicted metal-dependent RNase